MSLTPKRRTTKKAAARSQRNGRRSRGAATPEGKARAAKANLRHGYYSQAQDEALIALGEDPAAYRRLMKSLETDLAEAMEAQVVGRIGRTFWRMQRAERMQDGLAVKRLRSGMEREHLTVGPQALHIYKTYEALCALYRPINNPDPPPSSQEIEGLIAAFGLKPPEEIKKVFPLYRAYWEAAWKAPAPAEEDDEKNPTPSAAEAERDLAREKLEAVLDPVTARYGETRNAFVKTLEQIQSPENVAALMAPKDENTMLMQRMEDSSLRQLWRLTNILMKVRKGALTLTDSND